MDPNEIQTRELREALAQIKKELEETNLRHMRELAEVKEERKTAQETHERKINEALSTIHRLEAKSKVVSH